MSALNVPWKAELIAEAREAIANAKRKHQRWAIWERIVDEWECTPDNYDPAIADSGDEGAIAASDDGHDGLGFAQRNVLPHNPYRANPGQEK